MASPGTASPPPGKGYENSNGYFAREAVICKAGSRRESLSMFASDLHISSGNDSGDEAGPTAPSTPAVVRRAVTRRGNLLVRILFGESVLCCINNAQPKTRQFGRIRAELGEESAPIDSEVRREAEIIRQVRESDAEYDKLQSTTAQSSPSLLPAVPGLDGPLEGVPEEGSESGMSLDGSSTMATKGLFGAFNIGLPNSSNRNFWGNLESQSQAQTLPPPIFPRASSSAVSDDINMDSPTVSASTSLHSASIAGAQQIGGAIPFSCSSIPQSLVPPTAADGLKKSNKRRRDDDLDMNSIKRRAVSPGVSVHNSPILSQSPNQRDSSIWGTVQKPSREGSVTGAVTGHAAGERSNSGGSLASTTPALGPKRVGLQGMTDTNDGLMKMSIE
jgi:hypothetical protein